MLSGWLVPRKIDVVGIVRWLCGGLRLLPMGEDKKATLAGRPVEAFVVFLHRSEALLEGGWGCSPEEHASLECAEPLTVRGGAVVFTFPRTA